MVATNELGTLKCRKQEVLETLLILMAPFAPHIAEELWHQLGRSSSIHTANWPKYNAQYLVESSFNYPISINGKTRAQITFDLSATEAEIQSAVLENELVVKWMEGKPLKKFILVKGRIVNVVV
jgi:leucyl-tRNA synthetase